jgi:hypothetical protein
MKKKDDTANDVAKIVIDKICRNKDIFDKNNKEFLK